MKKAIISRTIKANNVNVLSVNIEDRTVNEKTVVVPVKYDTPEKVLAFIRKNDSTVVSVLSISVNEKLVGMFETDFIKNAKPFDNRSKENRGMVSKEVCVYSCRVLAVNSERKVIETTFVNVSTEKEARKACDNSGLLFVQLLSIDTTKQLYAMPVDKFEQLARPMKDRFTLA